MLHLSFFSTLNSHARVRVGWNGFSVCSIAVLFLYFAVLEGKRTILHSLSTLKSDENIPHA